MKGIIHRDIKPTNVLVAECDHQPVVKIIDFGVAKATNQQLTDKTMFTQFGQIIGTLDYMSPEQAKFNQLDVDTRSDVYSLGVLLYELLTGQTPIDKARLTGSGLEEVLRIIREEDPPRPSTRLSSSETLPTIAANRDTEPGKLAGQLRDDLDWVVAKAMAKERGDRYQSADALADDIERHLRHLPVTAKRPSLLGRARKFTRRHKTPVLLSLAIFTVSTIAVVLAVIAYQGKLKRHQQHEDLTASRTEARRIKEETERERWARARLPEIEALLESHKSVAAFQLAAEVYGVLRGDPDFQKIGHRVAIRPQQAFDIRPEGTTISYREALDTDAPWIIAGQSPLSGVFFPRGPLRFRFAKEGFQTREFQLDFPGFLGQYGTLALHSNALAREGMTYIDGGRNPLWDNMPATLSPFHIDRYEVSNAEFKKFIDSGGYEKSELWSDLDFLTEDITLSWQDAMRKFVDSTEKAGPATWANGTYPVGQENYPVSGVSWFEAMAYAKFVGKDLPTAYHLNWAANCDFETAYVVMQLSNFSQQGVSPRGAHQGIGRFDVYDMAGNVREWSYNEDDAGRRLIMGGCWDDPEYQFLVPDALSPWDRSKYNGFRCVAYRKEGPESETLASIKRIDPEKYKTPQPVEIEPLLSHYQYDQSLPLNPKIIQTEAAVQCDLCRHEIIEVDVTYADERFEIHLFIPRDGKDQYETVVTYPGWGAFSMPCKSLPDLPPDWSRAEAVLRTGRIVCLPIYKGSFNRHTGLNLIKEFSAPVPSIQARDERIKTIIDLRRTVDYLLTRDDVDPQRLIYFGGSWGGTNGPIALVTEPRLKAGVFVSGGYFSWEDNVPPEISAFQFARHVKQPVIMFNGSHDNIFPMTESSSALYRDLLNPQDKNMFVPLPGGHWVSPALIAEKIQPWLNSIFAAKSTHSDLAE